MYNIWNPVPPNLKSYNSGIRLVDPTDHIIAVRNCSSVDSNIQNITNTISRMDEKLDKAFTEMIAAIRSLANQKYSQQQRPPQVVSSSVDNISEFWKNRERPSAPSQVLAWGEKPGAGGDDRKHEDELNHQTMEDESVVSIVPEAISPSLNPVLVRSFSIPKSGVCSNLDSDLEEMAGCSIVEKVCGSGVVGSLVPDKLCGPLKVLQAPLPEDPETFIEKSSQAIATEIAELQLTDPAFLETTGQAQTKGDDRAKMMNDTDQLESIIVDLRLKSIATEAESLRKECLERVGTIERKVHVLIKYQYISNVCEYAFEKNTVMEEPWVPPKPPDNDKFMYIDGLGMTKTQLVNKSMLAQWRPAYKLVNKLGNYCTQGVCQNALLRLIVYFIPAKPPDAHLSRVVAYKVGCEIFLLTCHELGLSSILNIRIMARGVLVAGLLGDPRSPVVTHYSDSKAIVVVPFVWEHIPVGAKSKGGLLYSAQEMHQLLPLVSSRLPPLVRVTRQLLESDKKTDIKYVIEGEIIAAQKLVLAARSPVFRAQLFGPMKNQHLHCIEDIKLVVFKVMLHCWGSLPDMDEITTPNSKFASIQVSQHLLTLMDAVYCRLLHWMEKGVYAALQKSYWTTNSQEVSMNTNCVGEKEQQLTLIDSAPQRRKLLFKEAGQEYALVIRMLGYGRCEAMCRKMHKKAWIAAGDIGLVGLRYYQDDKVDVILKYMSAEARLLEAYGELPENTRLNEGIAGGLNEEDGFVLRKHYSDRPPDSSFDLGADGKVMWCLLDSYFHKKLQCSQEYKDQTDYYWWTCRIFKRTGCDVKGRGSATRVCVYCGFDLQKEYVSYWIRSVCSLSLVYQFNVRTFGRGIVFSADYTLAVSEVTNLEDKVLSEGKICYRVCTWVSRDLNTNDQLDNKP